MLDTALPSDPPPRLLPQEIPDPPRLALLPVLSLYGPSTQSYVVDCALRCAVGPLPIPELLEEVDAYMREAEAARQRLADDRERAGLPRWMPVTDDGTASDPTYHRLYDAARRP